MKCPICGIESHPWDMTTENWKRISRKLKRYKAMRKQLRELKQEEDITK